MQTRLQRWGNSLALRIPVAFARELHLVSDSVVDLTTDAGRLVLVPVSAPPTVPSLSELLERITPENLHDDVDWGAPRGTEAW